MATGKRTVTLGILGAAEVARSLVVDVLNDHFSLGPEDAEGYFGPSDKYELHMLIPAGQDATSAGVHAVWEWAVRCELPYKVLWDETTNEHTDDVLHNVVNPEDDTAIVADVHKAMVERLGQSQNPMLLVLSEEGATYEPPTAEAAATALREGIPVHDLSRALLEVTWRHLPDHEPPEEPALEVEPDGQMALTVVSDTPDVTLTAGEAVALNRTLIEAETFLDGLAGLVHGTDGLRQSFVHGRSLLAPRPETPADTGDDEKPKKTRLEIFNAETNQWEPAGRGRPPKGAQKRRVQV
ncbi:hypothetical protein [Streptomyces sp. NPDC057002]|uniref:hypothetical protein n=1 Tax=Streptomyces sp. NPDC057002 TaxID=3345992 RepID=UPI00364077DF